MSKKNKEQPQQPQPTIQLTADALRTILTDVLAKAQSENDWQQAMSIEAQKKADNPNITIPNSDMKTKKTLKAIKTGTFLDTMFLDDKDIAINGVPFGSSSILLGIPNTGKSLILAEIILRIANVGLKTCFVTSEEIYSTETNRYDLENRLKDKAKILGLNWKTISENLYVLDAVKFADLRNWETFASTLKELVENKKVEFLGIDSLTLLEDSRGQLKYRLLDLMKYGQTHGLTSIMISQRSGEDPDSIGSIAGGISLSHIADVVMVMDSKKVSSWDSQLKLDIPTAKQGQEVFFYHILKCRLCRYRANYFGYIIDKDGIVKLQ